jgi:hypothetical protein
MTASRATFALLLATLVSAPVPATADTILFSSVGPDPFAGTATVFGFNLGEEGDPDIHIGRAYPFVPSTTATFRSAELPLFFPCCDSIPGQGSVVINLFVADGKDGNVPGKLLESFMRTEAINLEVVSFRSVLQPLLVAGTTYFIEATTVGIATGFWHNVVGDQGPFQSAFRIDNGPWQARSQNFAGGFRIIGNDTAPVPEPTSLVLVGTGLAAALMRRRRTRARPI